MKKTDRKSIAAMVLALMAPVALAACSISSPAAKPAGSVNPIPPIGRPAALPIAAQWQAVKLVSDAPNALPAMSAAMAADPARIAFAPGTTSGSVAGTLAAQGVQSYILNASWNQLMIVSAASSSGAVFLEIHGVSDGVYLTTFANAQTSWQGWLPRTQAYIIRVYNASTAGASYTLAVEIPARIQFAPGAYSATIYGAGYNAQTISYILYAYGGQTFTATLSSATSAVVVALRGVNDGQYLVQSSAGDTTWTGTLPSTQNYILDAVQTGAWTSFTLTVTIV